MSDIFLKTTRETPMPPPVSTTGVVGWMRMNLFSSIGNSVVTGALLLLLLWLVPQIIDWAFVRAIWSGESGEACRVVDAGACWAFVDAKFEQFIYGRYPEAEIWRVNVIFLLLAGGLLPLALPRFKYTNHVVLFMLTVFPFAAFVMLLGGTLGMPQVETNKWGGLLLTLVVAITGIVVSLPLGVLLALGRRSDLPILRIFSVLFIEFWRGIPLITVLFMASVMLPLFLPDGVSVDKLLRALIGVALFSSAYMAEVIRGGLQAVPQGQYEAARALGLSYWQTIFQVVMPQALRIVIPGIVNTFIGLFKDTTLVMIVGLFDLLGIVQSNFTDPNWASPQTAISGYVFVALIFWVFCFSMSRYSVSVEKRVGLNQR